MIKIAHEAPISIFKRVQRLTDIDYFLVHLFEENEEYFNLARKAVENNREVILDNSIFELGKSFDPERYAQWIDNLRPAWYVIPDVLEDSSGTLNQLEDFKEYIPQLPGKTIAVAQGKTLFDFLYCFEKLHNDDVVDMIGISFDYSFYKNCFAPIDKDDDVVSNLEYWAQGRAYILSILNEFYLGGYFNKKVHLLGCALPQEFYYHSCFSIRSKGFFAPWIYSIDTSNPVVAGIEGVRYDGLCSLKDKSKTKLFTLMNNTISDEQWSVVEANINDFRRSWNE